MNEPLLISLPGNEAMGQKLSQALGIELGVLSTRRFPDGESYLRCETPIAQRSVALLCTLDRPDEKIMPLIFAAAAARDLGATRIGLIAPYLAYMRQDKRFHDGEAITSKYFAQLISTHFDWLATVDPHLHRWKALGETYTIPTVVAHSMPLISAWIQQEIKQPLVIGPDSESEQWVAAAARDAGAPHVILEKTRRGDQDVEVSVPDIEKWRHHQAVLLDDIISTARTMIETIRHIKRARMRPPVCIGVHGIFAGQACEDLIAAGVPRIITTNTIRHPTNGIEVSGLLAETVRSAVCLSR